MENLICNLWKLFIYISNYYHSKRSSRRCFQGNNFHHQVTGFVHAFSYVFLFLPSTIFLISLSYRGKFVHKNYAMKNRGHRARSRAKEHCTCLHGPFKFWARWRIRKDVFSSCHERRIKKNCESPWGIFFTELKTNHLYYFYQKH